VKCVTILSDNAIPDGVDLCHRAGLIIN